MNGRYRRITPEADGSLRSLTTGLLLRTEGKRLRLVDAATGEPLLWDEEKNSEISRERAARQAAEKKADQEATARRALEEELEQLRRELKRGS